MRVLVTGAAGFIGSWVCQRLLERGDAVLGLDNFDPFYARSIKQRNLDDCGAVRAGFAFHEGELCDRAQLDALLADADAVVHLAALAGVRPSLEAPARYMRVNVEGTTALLEACRAADVRRLVVASSSSVYGARSRTPFHEDDPCDRPASPYAASKRATELVCATHHQLYELGVSCLRYFTVYGPRQRPEMAIHKFVRRALAGEPLEIFGDGGSGRDYTYIDDAVAATLAALDRQDGGFHVYNVGGSQPVLLRDLVATIGEVLGVELRLTRLPWQAGDVPITCADVTRAERELGFQARVPLEDGLRRFLGWYRERLG